MAKRSTKIRNGGRIDPAITKDLVGAVSASARDLMRTCADHLSPFYGLASPDEPRMRLTQTMQHFDRQVRAERTPATIIDVIGRALENAHPDALLMLAPWTADNLKSEAGLDARPGEWRGHAVVVVERWRYGWRVQARRNEDW